MWEPGRVQRREQRVGLGGRSVAEYSDEVRGLASRREMEEEHDLVEYRVIYRLGHRAEARQGNVR